MMDLVRKYFPGLQDKQYERFDMLHELYSYWNSRINVVSRKDIDKLEVHHILHSLSIAKIISFQDGSKVCDVGTGGGFPGIPLAILFPETDFLLVDSIGKKIRVVNEVAKELGLRNALGMQSRIENINSKFDFIVSRAVSRLPVFLSWVKNMTKPNSENTVANGVLYIKGGDFQEELNAIRYPYNIYNIQDYFEEDFFETKKIVHVIL